MNIEKFRRLGSGFQRCRLLSCVSENFCALTTPTWRALNMTRWTRTNNWLSLGNQKIFLYFTLQSEIFHPSNPHSRCQALMTDWRMKITLWSSPQFTYATKKNTIGVCMNVCHCIYRRKRSSIFITFVDQGRRLYRHVHYFSKTWYTRNLGCTWMFSIELSKNKELKFHHI